MRAVFLDRESHADLDMTPVEQVLDELICHDVTEDDQVVDRLAGFDVVLVNKVKLDARVLARADGLKLICVLATGVNNVDLAAASAQGIRVCNAQGYGVESVAQHVLTLILALHTRVLDYDRAVRAGRWQQSRQFCLLDYPILELSGRTLGIIGHGALGSAVAQRAEALGMRVLIGARPGSTAVEPGRVPFEALIEQVDVLSLHCPLTEQTRDLIDAEVLARMKPGAFVVNAARGGIVNEQALADALRSGHLGGAATDVLSVEPPRDGNPLLDPTLPNLIVTPHCAWGSAEARERILQQTAESIQAFTAGDPLVRCVNP